MPVTTIDTDPDSLTMTVVADFSVPLQRLWDAYADPRLLERFWGPPTYPASFSRHDFFAGGFSAYTMTGPEGDQHAGYWEWLAVDPMKRFEVLDGFAHADGTPNRELPVMRMIVEFAQIGDGSRVTTTSHFASLADLEQVVAMGVVEGTRTAMGQMDDVLADLQSFAADAAVLTQIVSDTQVRISRLIRGSVEQVWRAHHDADLLKQWLLGPDGWSMPVCDVATEVGQTYRYEWAQLAGEQPGFGFEGEVLEMAAPHRSVTTERMIGMPGEGTVNELTLTEVSDGTLLTLFITYPSMELRDTVLGTGMTDGMETSYQRMEALFR